MEYDELIENSSVENGYNSNLCVRNLQGILVVIMVYLCFIYEYIITLYFAIWMQSLGNYDT